MKINDAFTYLSNEKLEEYFQLWMSEYNKRDLKEYEHEHVSDIVDEIHWREKGPKWKEDGPKYTITVNEKVRF